MDVLSNIVSAAIGSAFTLIGVVYKDVSNKKREARNRRNDAITAYFTEASKLTEFPVMSMYYSAAFTNAAVYMTSGQIQIAKEFEKAIQGKDSERAKTLLMQIIDLEKEISSKAYPKR